MDRVPGTRDEEASPQVADARDAIYGSGGQVAESSRSHQERRRCAAPLARRQRRALPLSGPPGARRATLRTRP